MARCRALDVITCLNLLAVAPTSITNTCGESASAMLLNSEIEAKLTLGLNTAKGRNTRGPNMPWDTFREEYRTRHLNHLRERSVEACESRLDIAERIIRPRTLGDMASADALSRLQSDLLAGKQSRFGKPRSPHTAKAYMAQIKAVLNWGASMELIPPLPKLRSVKTSKLRHAKGRPISTEEFERMLMATERAVGTEAAESWTYLLRGLWESGLRIDELMHCSWDDHNAIRPVWQRGRLPVLAIPHELQKNDTEESIPLLPGFESLLRETPLDDRTGWIFKPKSLQGKVGRSVRHQRPKAA